MRPWKLGLLAIIRVTTGRAQGSSFIMETSKSRLRSTTCPRGMLVVFLQDSISSPPKAWDTRHDTQECYYSTDLVLAAWVLPTYWLSFDLVDLVHHTYSKIINIIRKMSHQVIVTATIYLASSKQVEVQTWTWYKSDKWLPFYTKMMSISDNDEHIGRFGFPVERG